MRQSVSISVRKSLAGRLLVSFLSASLVVLSGGPRIVVCGQSPSSLDRERGREMLKNIKNGIEKNYYDPQFHGINLEARFKVADEKIASAQSQGQIFGIIAQALIDFNDSHLFFIPPSHVSSVEYGWEWQAIGDQTFVLAVKPGSDAEAKGLKPGDRLLGVDSYLPNRDNAWKLAYLYNMLRPQSSIHLIVESPDGTQRALDILAKVKAGQQVIDLTGRSGSSDIYDLIRQAENEAHFNRQRYYEMEDVMIWKMPHFELSDSGVDETMAEAKKHKALILDLRGNGGGYVKTLQRLLGHFFDHDVKVGDLKRRTETKELVAKKHSSKPFTGKLIVLVDSKSASASELFARVIQLEKRGTIIGDRSAGEVMLSKGYEYKAGIDRVVFYGASITDADLVMTDGKSLEHSGVQPDELLLPTGAEIVQGEDKVLSRAAELAGAKLDPEKAGTLFPIEWRR